MSANSVYCHVINKNITVVTDINGKVKNIVCPEFSRLSHGCLKKFSDNGFIGSALGKISDRLIGTRANCCEFADPNDTPVTKLLGE